MLDTIVVPLDGSETSTRAIAAATVVARAIQVPIQLVTVISPGINPLEAEMELRAFLKEVDAPTRDPVVLASNDVVGALTEFVAARGRALLCLATHGRGSVGTTVLGSIAAEVLARSHDPVLLIGPEAQPVAEFADIIVGVEVSAANARQVPSILPWAQQTGARVHLINVETDAEAVVVGGDGARAFVSELALQYRAGGAAACWRTLPGDDVPGLLNDAATGIAAAMVVVGGTQLGRIRAHVGLGSVAQRVVRHAPCPVLVIPPALVRDEQP